MKKRTVRFAVACALAPAALALTGCATTTGSTSGSATDPANAPTRSDVYVYAVDRAAERRGVRVIWVNPPKGGESARLGYSLDATVGDEDGRD